MINHHGLRRLWHKESKNSINKEIDGMEIVQGLKLIICLPPYLLYFHLWVRYILFLLSLSYSVIKINACFLKWNVQYSKFPMLCNGIYKYVFRTLLTLEFYRKNYLNFIYYFATIIGLSNLWFLLEFILVIGVFSEIFHLYFQV